MLISPEDRLLLCCARKNMDKCTTQKLRETLSGNLDWNYITKSAFYHGISPLLYYNLIKIDDGTAVPKEFMENLRKHYYGYVARNMFLYDELGKVLKVFKNDGIDVIVLKGAALAETVYKSIGLRPMGDIDILVRKKDLQKAKRKISELGYVLNKEVSPEAYNEKFGCDLRYVDRAKASVLEIHWHVVRKIGIDAPTKIEIDTMWKNAMDAKISGIDALILSPEDLLLHSCVHLPKHHYNRLIWFCDILEVIKYNDNINWAYVIKNAKKYRIKIWIYYALYFAGELLDAPIPADVLDNLRPRRFKVKLLEFVINQKKILHLEYAQGKDISIFYSILLNILLMEKTKDSIKYLMTLFFPPAEQLSIIYSISKSKKIYFYYFVHPVSICFRSTKILVDFIHYRIAHKKP